MAENGFITMKKPSVKGQGKGCCIPKHASAYKLNMFYQSRTLKTISLYHSQLYLLSIGLYTSCKIW